MCCLLASFWKRDDRRRTCHRAIDDDAEYAGDRALTAVGAVDDGDAETETKRKKKKRQDRDGRAGQAG